jgi:AcrR family transcriptional regulator
MAEERERRAPAGAAVLRADKTAAIIDAALQELADAGYRRLTMDAVAARAGVGKAALYRRWRSKDEMLIDLIVGAAQTTLPPDTGSLETDLTSFIGAVIDALQQPLVARIGLELQAEASRNPALADALVTRFREPRRAAGEAMLARATERGEIPVDADIELALDLIAGPLLMHGLLIDEPFERDYASRLANAVLKQLSPS